MPRNNASSKESKETRKLQLNFCLFYKIDSEWKEKKGQKAINKTCKETMLRKVRKAIGGKKTSYDSCCIFQDGL